MENGADGLMKVEKVLRVAVLPDAKGMETMIAKET